MIRPFLFILISLLPIVCNAVESTQDAITPNDDNWRNTVEEVKLLAKSAPTYTEEEARKVAESHGYYCLLLSNNNNISQNDLYYVFPIDEKSFFVVYKYKLFLTPLFKPPFVFKGDYADILVTPSTYRNLLNKKIPNIIKEAVIRYNSYKPNDNYTLSQAYDLANLHTIQKNLKIADNTDISKDPLYYVFRLDDNGFIIVVKQKLLFENPILMVRKGISYEHAISYKSSGKNNSYIDNKGRTHFLLNGTYQSLTHSQLLELHDDILLLKQMFNAKVSSTPSK